MIKTIVWSPLAIDDFEKILEYLNRNWPASVVNEFIDKVDNMLTLIMENPQLFSMINKDNKVRKSVLTKHNSIFYTFDKDNVMY
jgi:plasmid stabilization system protein ParE